jgi:hypothetical protein
MKSDNLTFVYELVKLNVTTIQVLVQVELKHFVLFDYWVIICGRQPE